MFSYTCKKYDCECCYFVNFLHDKSFSWHALSCQPVSLCLSGIILRQSIDHAFGTLIDNWWVNCVESNNRLRKMCPILMIRLLLLLSLSILFSYVSE